MIQTIYTVILSECDIDVVDPSKLVTLDEIGQKDIDIDVINEIVNKIVTTGSVKVNNDVSKIVSARDIIGRHLLEGSKSFTPLKTVGCI